MNGSDDVNDARRGLAGPQRVFEVKHRASGGLVYSTDAGRMCPACRQPVVSCVCKQAVVPAGDGLVRVSRETKGRAGKGVTLVRGLALDTTALTAVAKQLKAACGSGGTVKNGVIEVQGDHAERVVAWLQAEGHAVKRAGG
jgi:translation initiation factor 1